MDAAIEDVTSCSDRAGVSVNHKDISCAYTQKVQSLIGLQNPLLIEPLCSEMLGFHLFSWLMPTQNWSSTKLSKATS